MILNKVEYEAVPMGEQALFLEDLRWVAIDNPNGEAFVEDFEYRFVAEFYLKNRDIDADICHELDDIIKNDVPELEECARLFQKHSIKGEFESADIILNTYEPRFAIRYALARMHKYGDRGANYMEDCSFAGKTFDKFFKAPLRDLISAYVFKHMWE